MIRLLGLVVALGAQSGDWSTHRGNAARTGASDAQPGPAKPKVLWVHASNEHFVASPVAAGDRLFLPALGAFNTASFHSVDLADRAAKRYAWTKTAPMFRAPSVCAPAVVEGRVVLGDGMHQTDGASLHCLRASDGRSLWRLSVPGELVHIEGSPTVAGGRVYVGAGNAGVFCVDLNRVTFEGKEVPLAEAEASIDKRWKDLLAKFEEEKKKDPDFAIPPNEMVLPQPSPKVWWQQGKGAWHVDGPTGVAEGRVLVGSAFLDKEKLGERALLCLDAQDGKVLWKAALKWNPWGGATVAGARVLVSCSSIRYDPHAIPGARGEIVALKLADGAVEWRREVDAGVLGSVVAAGDLALFTDTGGRVQALDVKTGEPRWTYAAGAPLFAGPAVSKDAAYAADLKGAVHAVALSDGKAIWKFDAAAAAGAPGMVYGSPALHRGRLYLATCNLEGESAGKPTALLCIGSE
jgi:outer membrane protein assembly factor BamB